MAGAYNNSHHDGIIPAIEAATSEYKVMHPEFKIAVLLVWWVSAGQLVPNGTFQILDSLGHGGEGETAMMLYVDQHLLTCLEQEAWSPSYLHTWK
jgi:creatinine amidohydrolase/Fe(II)-dependent formamide hydrolase-like protein